MSNQNELNSNTIDSVTKTVSRFIKGNSISPPTEKLERAKADARARIERAQAAYDSAALNSFAGDKKAIDCARQELTAAIEDQRTATAALSRAQKIAKDRADEMAIKARSQAWEKTLKLAREREECFANIEKYFQWAARELRKIDDLNQSMNDACPVSLATHESSLASFFTYARPVELALGKAGVTKTKLVYTNIADQPSLVEKLSDANLWLEKLAGEDIRKFESAQAREK